MHEGSFRGGAIDGRTLTIRSHKGVLVTDKQAGLAWLYRSNDGQYYDVVTDDADPATGTRQLDEDLAIQAAEDGYDVIAHPGNEPGREEIDEEVVITDGE